MARDLFSEIPAMAGQNPGRDVLQSTTMRESANIPLGDRAGLSLKITPEGKTSYLREKYGNGNVHVLDSGAAFLRGADGNWRPIDEAEFTVGDIADEAGPALETIPAAVAGVMTANPAGAAAGGAAGSIVRQAASSMLPGSDDMSIGDRAKSVAIDAGLAGATQGAVNGVFKSVDWLRPGNIVARHAQKLNATPYAKEGDILESAVGPLSVGQRTGSRSLLMAEGVARQMPSSADSVFAFDQSQVRAAVTKLGDVLDGIKKGADGADTVGFNVIGTYKNAVNKVLDLRRKQARIDFGEVDKLAGGKRVIPTGNTVSEIDRIIADLDVPGGGDASATLVSRLKDIRTQLDPIPEKKVSGNIVDAAGKPMTETVTPSAPANVSANQINRLLQIYGNAAKGTGQIFNDIDKGQQRMIAGRLFGALQRDLDEAADSMGEESVAAALKKARDNYKSNSQGLGKLEQTVLGRMLDSETPPAPEAIAKKFMTMYPTEIKAVVSILNDANPETVSSIKRYMLEEVMDKAKAAPSQKAGPGISFSGNKFNTALNQNYERLKSVLSPGEINQVRQVSRYLERVVDRAGMQGSQTGPFMLMWDAMKSGFTVNPVGMVRTGVTFLAPRHIAKAMTTAEGRNALMTLTKTQKQTKGTVAAISYLTTLIATDDDAAPYRPQSQEDRPQ